MPMPNDTPPALSSTASRLPVPEYGQYSVQVGYEGKGVWVLDFYAQDDPKAVWDSYNMLPPTFDVSSMP
jgi:hypothetical protein